MSDQTLAERLRDLVNTYFPDGYGPRRRDRHPRIEGHHIADEVKTQADLLRDRIADLEFEYGLRVKGEATIEKLEAEMLEMAAKVEALDNGLGYWEDIKAEHLGLKATIAKLEEALRNRDEYLDTVAEWCPSCEWINDDGAKECGGCSKALEDTDE